MQAAASAADAVRPLLVAGLDLVRQTATALSPLLPGVAGGSSLCEFGNKLAAFTGFTAAVLPATPGEVALRAAIRADLAGDPYAAVWKIEGRGHRWGGRLPRRPAGEGASVGDLPEAALVPFHAGLGLALAERCLAAAVAAPSPALRSFGESCSQLAPPGYEGVVFEALGLAARTLRPELVPRLDRELRALPAAAGRLALFWHGIGRGIYLAPSNGLPFTLAARRAAVEAVGRSPHAMAAANAAAGLAFAAVLVNVRHPEVVEPLLTEWEERLPAASIEQGAAAALRVWGRLSPFHGALADRFSQAGEQLAARQAAEGAAALFRCPAPGAAAARWS
jgi:hypothetical protein